MSQARATPNAGENLNPLPIPVPEGRREERREPTTRAHTLLLEGAAPGLGEQDVGVCGL